MEQRVLRPSGLMLKCILDKWDEDEISSEYTPVSGLRILILIIVSVCSIIPPILTMYLQGECIGKPIYHIIAFGVSAVIVLLCANKTYSQMLKYVKAIAQGCEKHANVPSARFYLQYVLKVCEIGKEEMPIAEAIVSVFLGGIGGFFSFLLFDNAACFEKMSLYLIFLAISSSFLVVFSPLHKFYILLSAELKSIISTTSSPWKVSVIVNGKNTYELEIKNEE